ncbi:DUF2062 domain-containing protein [Maribellus mangrovi]|uniref:DUF2062 domain-containing protein n=1 Tax=Maribellus mangrovi TaxID=3133146 RepID=UPI0030EC3B5F
MEEKYSAILSETLVVIPTYNNNRTVATIINEVLPIAENLLVVNDGSTDNTSEILKTFGDKIVVIVNPVNKGKGYSIRRAFKYALQNGYKYVITLDSDGQHFANDIPEFIKDVIHNGPSLIVGARNMNATNVPGKSSFGNRFSNFWYWVETGDKLEDTQSGFRLYPIELMKDIHFKTNRFEFEVEVLVRTQWNYIKVKNIPIKIHYETPELRVSHFKPVTDFVRISILNTVLFLIAFLYIHPRNLFKYFSENNIVSIIKDVLKKHNETPFKIASAMGFGVFMGIVPFWGFQMMLAALFAHRLKLNKALVLLASNISIPPMIPILIYMSYQTGYLVYNGTFDRISNIFHIADFIINEGVYNALTALGNSILYYLVGSFIFGILSGLLTWGLTMVFIKIKQRVL